jgi:hypothetical protein
MNGSQNDAIIDNVSSSGSIEATFSGGIVGSNGLMFDPNDMVPGGSIKQSDSDASLEGKSAVGGISSYNYGLLEGNSFTGETNLTRCSRIACYSGGIAGYSISKIIRSNSSGSVSSSSELSEEAATGGVVGALLNTSVKNSHSASAVSGPNVTGGLAGDIINSTVEYSYSRGTVSGGDESGGLIGKVVGNISESFSTTRVNGKNHTGGLVGNFSSGDLLDSYALGDVNYTDESGGIAGGLVALVGSNAEIDRSYSAGQVYNVDASGLVGKNTNVIVDSYWDKEKSNQSSSDGGVGLNSLEMQGDPASGNMTGFEFGSVWSTVQEEYPVLQAIDEQTQLNAR